MACLLAAWALLPHRAAAQPVCPERPSTGSVVAEPEDLRSVHGVLRVDLRFRSSVDVDGRMQYCYVSSKGGEAPTLRLKPGDLLVLAVKNEQLVVPPMDIMPGHPRAASGACSGGAMSAASTNVHFHGVTVRPVCHQDDVIHTLIQPGEDPFVYRFRIPANEPPGLYWYHPHVHGMTRAQVLGGASGALVVEGTERANPRLAGLSERVFVIRDQELLNPDAAPVQTDSMPPPMVMRDAEGDVLNSGTGGGKPAKDLSINFVSVAYPSYTPAVINAVTTVGDYIPHHEPFQYYASTSNLHHVQPTNPALIGTSADGANHQYDLGAFWTALAEDNLPSVTYLKAAAFQDSHPGYSDPIDEQEFVVGVVNAVQKSRFWNDTAIIIAYDDSDGWYDHVLGPIVNQSAVADDAFVAAGNCGSGTTATQGRCGYGPRLPLLVISPYAKPNYVDHRTTDQSSILRFIEDNWDLGRIGADSSDVKAGTLNGMFDFREEHRDSASKLILDPATGLVISH